MFPPLVSRVTGNLLVSIADPKKKVIDIGLGVKSPRIRCYKPGYARKVEPKRMSQAVTGVIYEYSEEVREARRSTPPGDVLIKFGG